MPISLMDRIWPLFFVVPVVVGALMIGNRGTRGPQPMPRMARRAAALAGIAWVVAAFEFVAVFGGALFQTVVSYEAARLVWLVAIMAAPVTLLLGLLLFVPTRRMLLWSTLWAATVAVGAGVVRVALPELVGGALAYYVAAPVVAGLLSVLAWRQLAEGRRPPSPTV